MTFLGRLRLWLNPHAHVRHERAASAIAADEQRLREARRRQAELRRRVARLEFEAEVYRRQRGGAG